MKTQIFLLHFAGGNSYSFQSMKSFLVDFEVIPLELPGRGKRSNEMLLKDFELAAFDLYGQISNQLTSTCFTIYGHSMGAYLALKVTELLEQAGKVPLCLFVSGNAGPGIRPNKKRYELPLKEFVEEINKLGGIRQEVIENKELFDYYLPILRADFEISENNGNVSPVKSDIYAFMGSLEEDVNQIFNWAKYSNGKFHFKILDGNHFFIYDHAQLIANIIKDYCVRLSLQY